MQVIPVRHFLQYRTSYDAADDIIEVTCFLRAIVVYKCGWGFAFVVLGSLTLVACHHYFSL